MFFLRRLNRVHLTPSSPSRAVNFIVAESVGYVSNLLWRILHISGSSALESTPEELEHASRFHLRSASQCSIQMKLSGLLPVVQREEPVHIGGAAVKNIALDDCALEQQEETRTIAGHVLES